MFSIRKFFSGNINYMNNFDQPKLPYPEEQGENDTADKIEGEEIKSGEEISNGSITTINPTSSDYSENPEKISETNLITKSGKFIKPDIVEGLQEAIKILIERGRDTDFTEETLELALRELFGENKIPDKYYYGERVWENTLPDIRFVEKNPKDGTYHLLEKEYEEFKNYYSNRKLPAEKSESLPGSVEVKPEDLGMLLFFKNLYRETPTYYPWDDNPFNEHYGTKRLNESKLLSMLSYIFDTNQREEKKGLNKILNSALNRLIIEEVSDFPPGRKPIKWYYYNDKKMLLPPNYSEDAEEIEIEKFIKKATEYFK